MHMIVTFKYSIELRQDKGELIVMSIPISALCDRK